MSRFSLGLDVSVASFDDKSQSVPLRDHVFMSAIEIADPRDLRASGLRENIIGPLSRPPGQLAILCAIVEVRLPWYCHLLGDVARRETRGVQPKWFQEFVAVAQE